MTEQRFLGYFRFAITFAVSLITIECQKNIFEQWGDSLQLEFPRENESKSCTCQYYESIADHELQILKYMCLQILGLSSLHNVQVCAHKP